jgi:hypothetical protein
MRVSQLIKRIFKYKPEENQNSKGKSQKSKSKVKNPEQEAEKPTELEIIKARLTKLEGDLAKATGGYRQMLVQSHPDILPELIGGDSVEAIDHSLAAAKQLTERIREKLEQKTAAEKIPGGAPARTPPDTSNLSSHEKIIYGLEQK